MNLLEVSGLSAAYGSVVALRDVSVHVDEGEAVVIIGANGAGKSTLLKAVTGQIPVTGGSVRFAGREMTGTAPEAAAARGLVLVPEGRGIFPDLTTLENLQLGGYTMRRSRDRLRGRIQEVFEIFPVLATRSRQAAGTLSGGEQQMLAVGRALVAEPRLLLLDEPSLGLAPRVCGELFDLLARLRERGLTLLLVEQLAYLALALVDRAYVLENGRIALEGSAEQLRSDDRVREVYLGVRGAEGSVGG